MSFFIRCTKGHRNFTVSLFRGNDLEDEGLEAMNDLETGEFVLLSCTECREEEVLEIEGRRREWEPTSIGKGG